MTKKIVAQCSVEGCLNEYLARGYCRKHYSRWRAHGDPSIVLEGVFTPAKFWQKVALTADDTRCWEWLGTLNGRGYGTQTVNYKRWSAHHYAWFLTYGYKPHTLLHTCDNTKCVNPKHLVEGRQKDNIWDMMNKGRYIQSRHTITYDEFMHVKALLVTAISISSVRKATGIRWEIVKEIQEGTHWSCMFYDN